MEIRDLTKDDVRIEVLIEDEEVGPRSILTDPDHEDTIREIERRLQKGESWAWCTVRVKVSFEQFSDSAYLGCCSYRDDSDFVKNSGYYDDMVNEALEGLNNQLQNFFEKFKPLIQS